MSLCEFQMYSIMICPAAYVAIPFSNFFFFLACSEIYSLSNFPIHRVVFCFESFQSSFGHSL